MGSEKIARRSSFGSMVRKTLSDITNSQSQPKSLISDKHEIPPQISPVSDDYVTQLLMEKMTLVKLIEERNKIIELSGTELQNLRTCLQKLQLQNWNLAQSNTQMLAELNLGKDRLKALQHEVVCKDALLKAKNMELKQAKKGMRSQNTSCHGGQQAVDKSMAKFEDDDDDKQCGRNRRRNARSQSMGPSTTSQRSGDKEKIENKRRCLRRQSARLNSQEREPNENLFELEDIEFADTPSPMHEDGQTPLTTSSSSSSSMVTCSNLKAERCSIGRPLRRAAEKVQSYKEVPLNVKMRRND